MPHLFQKLGLSFQYPENWTLDQHEALEGEDSVAVYSPGGGFWSIVVHPRSTSPKELADAALAAMRQVYEELDAEEVEESQSGFDLVGSDLNFYCLDLTNTAMIRAFSTWQANYLILCQAEDREFDRVEAVFRAITASLLQSL